MPTSYNPPHQHGTVRTVPPSLATSVPLPFPSLAGQLYPAIDAFEYYLKNTVVAIDRLPVWDNHKSPYPELTATLERTKQLREAWCNALWDTLGVLWLNAAESYDTYRKVLAAALRKRHVAELQTICGSLAKSSLHPSHQPNNAYIYGGGIGYGDGGGGRGAGGVAAVNSAALGSGSASSSRGAGGNTGHEAHNRRGVGVTRAEGDGGTDEDDAWSVSGGGGGGGNAGGGGGNNGSSLQALLMALGDSAAGHGLAEAPFFPSPPPLSSYTYASSSYQYQLPPASGSRSAAAAALFNNDMPLPSTSTADQAILAFATFISSITNPKFAMVAAANNRNTNNNNNPTASESVLLGVAGGTLQLDPAVSYLLHVAVTTPPTPQALERAIVEHLASRGLVYDPAADTPSAYYSNNNNNNNTIGGHSSTTGTGLVRGGGGGGTEWHDSGFGLSSSSSPSAESNNRGRFWATLGESSANNHNRHEASATMAYPSTSSGGSVGREGFSSNEGGYGSMKTNGYRSGGNPSNKRSGGGGGESGISGSSPAATTTAMLLNPKSMTNESLAVVASLGKITRLVLRQVYEQSVLDATYREHCQVFSQAKANDRMLLQARLDRFSGMLMLVTDAVESKMAAGVLPLDGGASVFFAGGSVGNVNTNNYQNNNNNNNNPAINDEDPTLKDGNMAEGNNGTTDGLGPITSAPNNGANPRQQYSQGRSHHGHFQHTSNTSPSRRSTSSIAANPTGGSPHANLGNASHTPRNNATSPNHVTKNNGSILSPGSFGGGSGGSQRGARPTRHAPAVSKPLGALAASPAEPVNTSNNTNSRSSTRAQPQQYGPGGGGGGGFLEATASGNFGGDISINTMPGAPSYPNYANNNNGSFATSSASAPHTLHQQQSQSRLTPHHSTNRQQQQVQQYGLAPHPPSRAQNQPQLPTSGFLSA